MAQHNAQEPEALGEAMNKTELFFEKNGRKFSYIFIALLILAGLIYGYRALIMQPRVEAAAEMMVGAQENFEQKQYEAALNGDEAAAGFMAIIDQYGSTPSGNLARHYAGICFMQLGQLDEAENYLAQFSEVDGIPGQMINAQNYGLQGDIAVEKDDYKQAVKLYKKAIEAADNHFTTPMYLRKAGLAEMAAGNKEAAKELFQQVLDYYGQSADAQEVIKLIGTIQ